MRRIFDFVGNFLCRLVKPQCFPCKCTAAGEQPFSQLPSLRMNQDILCLTGYTSSSPSSLLLAGIFPVWIIKMVIPHFGPITELPTPSYTCWHIMQISLMVTDIQNISHFLWNLQSFAFSITGAVSVPMSGVPLDLWLQDLWSHYNV